MALGATTIKEMAMTEARCKYGGAPVTLDPDPEHKNRRIAALESQVKKLEADLAEALESFRLIGAGKDWVKCANKRIMDRRA